MLYIPIGKYSSKPFHINELGLGIHTIEELSYYLKENATALDESIMTTELCGFISRELGMTGLGDALRDLVDQKGSLAAFVRLILEESGYVSEEEMRSIEMLLRSKSMLGAGERRKSRGDYHLTASRYLEAQRDYLQALKLIDPDGNRELYAACEHNLGCALAGMYLYERAAKRFEHAYILGRDEKSYIQYLAAMRMSRGRDEYLRAVNEAGVMADRAKRLEEKLDELDALSDDRELLIADMLEDLDRGDMALFDKRCDALLSEMKKEYRRDMSRD